MVFPTLEFALFFLLVLAVSWALMPWPRWWKPFILLASYFFYGVAEPRFCVLLAVVTLWNQAAAVAMKGRSDSWMQRIAVVAVVGNLGLLGWFKYYGFFVESVSQLLTTMGLHSPLPLLQVALPVGLSFFLFQAISYVLDVRAGRCEVASTLDFAIYLSFFPHLVSGPIVRAREFIPQLATPRNRREVAVGAGVSLIVLGLFKKVILADTLARGVVDPVFSVPQNYARIDVLLAMMSYEAQSYCDFAGYTDMAIGIAMLMGFIFPQNFDSPCRSTSLREYWSRWHMTFARFMRDYVYIPLGGARGGTWKTNRNILLTWTLVGLWHGANWGFVAWGSIHGLGLVVERTVSERIDRNREQGRGDLVARALELLAAIPRPIRWMATLSVVFISCIPFRAARLDLALAVASRLGVSGPATLWKAPHLCALIAVFGGQLLPLAWVGGMRGWFDRRGALVLGTVLAVALAAVAALTPSDGVPTFIYFRF